MTFLYLVAVKVDWIEGETVSREELRAELVSSIKSIDSDVFVGDSFYQVRSIDVTNAPRKSTL